MPHLPAMIRGGLPTEMLRTVETRPTSAQQVTPQLHRPAGVLYSHDRCDMSAAEGHTIIDTHKLDFANVSEKS